MDNQLSLACTDCNGLGLIENTLFSIKTGSYETSIPDNAPVCQVCDGRGRVKWSASPTSSTTF